MLKTITIDNRDLAFTVDTYATFTLDNEYEQEVDALIEQGELPEESAWDTIEEKYDVKYDMKGYLQHLAECSIEILENQFIGAFDYTAPNKDGVRAKNEHGIVKKIELSKTQSPQFYNYTTDSYTADWTIDTEKLNKFIRNNGNAYNDFVRENWRNLDTEDEDEILVAMLDFYTRQKYDDGNCIRVDAQGETYFDDESYILEMFEKQQGYEYIHFNEKQEKKNA